MADLVKKLRILLLYYVLLTVVEVLNYLIKDDNWLNLVDLISDLINFNS